MPGAEVGFNTNAIGGCLILFIPVQVSLLALGTSGRFPGARQPWSNSVFWMVQMLLLVTTAGTLVLTESRTSWIALIIGVAFFLLWHNRWTRARVALATAAVVAWVVGWSASDQAFDTIVSRAGPAFVSTWDLREKLWPLGVHGIQDHPITGFGMNVFRKIMLTRYPGFPALPGEEPAHVHNHLLQAALDLGIPGLVALSRAVDCGRCAARSSSPTIAGADYRSIASGLGRGPDRPFHFRDGRCDSARLEGRRALLVDAGVHGRAPSCWCTTPAK